MPPRTATLALLILAACGGKPSKSGGDAAANAALIGGLTTDAARSAAELKESGAPTVSGVLDCIGGDWTVLAWRLAPSTRRGPTGLPKHPPEVAVSLGSPGAYEIPVPLGPRRLVAAVETSTGTIAWSDEKARALPVHGDIARLDLDCTLQPREILDEAVPQGEPVTAALVEEAKRPVRIVSKDGGPPTLEAQLRRNGRGFGGVHTEQLIRARYAHRLTTEELEAHMPMLLQLADDPKAGDAFVRDLTRVRRAPRN